MKAFCPICSSVFGKALFSGQAFDTPTESFQVFECFACGLAFTEKPKKPMGSYYPASYYGSQSSKFRPLIEGLVRWSYRTRTRPLMEYLTQAEVSGKKKVLDLGCGRGGFLKALRAPNLLCYGIEIPEFEFGEEQEGIRFFHGPLEKLEFPAEMFDAVSIWHVLEHVENPGSTLREVGRIMRPAGVLCIAVPNFFSLQSKLFGKNWFHLDLPRHLFHFSKEGIEKLLAVYGFTVVKTSTETFDQNVFGFIQSALNCLFPNRQNEFYNLLKVGGSRPKSSWARKAIYYFLAGILFPFALLENSLSVFLGKGACLVVYARKKDLANLAK